MADVEHYEIAVDTYHYVIACSCLEHMSSEDAFVSKIEQMQAGTVHQGIHCIAMSTEVKEIDQETGLEEEGLIELNLSADRAFSILDELYSEWEIFTRRQVQQDIQEVKGGRDVLFEVNGSPSLQEKECVNCGETYASRRLWSIDSA